MLIVGCSGCIGSRAATPITYRFLTKVCRAASPTFAGLLCTPAIMTALTGQARLCFQELSARVAPLRFIAEPMAETKQPDSELPCEDDGAGVAMPTARRWSQVF